MKIEHNDRPQENPFSLAEFKAGQIGIAASRAIEDHAVEIRRAAEAGEPPIAVIAAELAGGINEGLHWRMVDRMIREWLGPAFAQLGTKPVGIRIHPRGYYYGRTWSCS